MVDKDETPLSDNLADVAAAEGVASSSPGVSKNGKRLGRPPKRARTAADHARDAATKARKKAAASGSSSSGPTPAEAVPDEPPFSASELRDVMGQVGAALFALPGDIMAARRPDLADQMQLTQEQAAFGGKAVVYFVAKRFPDLLEKWGPEAFLLGAAAIVYGPRIVVMAKTPKPDATATVDGKPTNLHAVP